MITLLVVFPALFLPIFAQQSSDVLILTQIIIRDSQGNLIISLEPTKIGYLNIVALNSFLNEESTVNDPIMNIGNQKMQIIQRLATLDFDSENVISDTTLNTFENGKTITLVRLIHDGLPVTPEDDYTTIWTFIRPLK